MGNQFTVLFQKGIKKCEYFVGFSFKKRTQFKKGYFPVW